MLCIYSFNIRDVVNDGNLFGQAGIVPIIRNSIIRNRTLLSLTSEEKKNKERVHSFYILQYRQKQTKIVSNKTVQRNLQYNSNYIYKPTYSAG